jgi:hypothetical protein
MCSWDSSNINTGYLAFALSSIILLCGSYLSCCYCTSLIQTSRITFTTFNPLCLKDRQFISKLRASVLARQPKPRYPYFKHHIIHFYETLIARASGWSLGTFWQRDASCLLYKIECISFPKNLQSFTRPLKVNEPYVFDSFGNSFL